MNGSTNCPSRLEIWIRVPPPCCFISGSNALVHPLDPEDVHVEEALKILDRKAFLPADHPETGVY